MTTFAELKQLVADYSHRSDLTTNIATFIALAENRIATDARALLMTTTGTIVEADRVSGGVYKLPADFLSIRSLEGSTSGGPYALQAVGRNEIIGFARSASGTASVYSIRGVEIELQPAPGPGIEFTILYYARFSDLANDLDTNVLLDAQLELYLYGALAELHRFAQEYDEAGVADQVYVAAVNALNNQDERTRFGQNPSPVGSYNYSAQRTVGDF